MTELWTDVLRNTAVFSTEEGTGLLHDTHLFLHKMNEEEPGKVMGPIRVDIPTLRVNMFDDQHVLTYMSGYRQPATYAAVWASDIDQFDLLHYDDSVGQPAPPHAVITKQEGYNGETGDFWAFNPTFHRDDRPASIIATGLHRSYRDGRLDHPAGKPSVYASCVIARWFQHNEAIRFNGPDQVIIRGYREYHAQGQLVHVAYDSCQCHWSTRKAPTNIAGPVTPLGVRYFTDPQDEFIWAAQTA